MLSEWLRSSLEKTGRSQAELARALTEALGRSIDRAAVNKMVLNRRKISADELVAITRYLEVDPPLELGAPAAAGLRSVKVAAHVQAGHWAETWEWSDDEYYDVAVPADPELEGYRLFAAETRGPSMNRRWPEGTVVVFTNVIETEEAPIPGKRYVVERKRLDGLMEHTVKLLHRDEDGRYWLIPESTDPRFQAPMPVDDDVIEGDEVRIIGRVRYAVSRE